MNWKLPSKRDCAPGPCFSGCVRFCVIWATPSEGGGGNNQQLRLEPIQRLPPADFEPKYQAETMGDLDDIKALGRRTL
jgi:hypothetical protein